MSEKLITRAEHSRSIEDAERYRALDTLKEIGLLIPLSELETYHGRAGTTDSAGEWDVDPAFSNGGNATGNRNVNSRPTLYTSDRQVAKDFAEARLIKSKGSRQVDRRQFNPADPDDTAPLTDEYQTEIHEIVSTDPDAVVIKCGFNQSNLDANAKNKYLQAMKTLAIPVSEGSPLSFEHRHKYEPFNSEMDKLPSSLIEHAQATYLASKTGVEQDAAMQIAGAHNSRKLVEFGMLPYLVKNLVDNPSNMYIGRFNSGDGTINAPVNLEYVQRFLRESHIVGVEQYVHSATLRKDIITMSLFDLEKVKTAKGVEKEKQLTRRKLGSLAMVFDKLPERDAQTNNDLLDLLEDVYAKPRELIEAAKKVDGYKNIFNADAGNWEGFTLAEHTETVLRNFDENFADKIPVQLVAPMRLALIAHDVGKPAAAAKGEKHRQKEYNIAYASHFLSKLDVDERTKGLILGLIGDGAKLANQIFVNDKAVTAESKAAMTELATKTLKKFYETDSIDNSQIAGFVDLCKMLLVCDGGAYTSMAVTRGKHGFYRNAPSFNKTFDKSPGFGERSIALKKTSKTTGR